MFDLLERYSNHLHRFDTHMTTFSPHLEPGFDIFKPHISWYPPLPPGGMVVGKGGGRVGMGDQA